jgi:5-methylcytosine-specific restriction endonuclease McrA
MTLPAPLTPPDLDLRDFDWMPLQVVRLRDSGIVVVASAEAFRAAVLLWCAAWHQVPAASLPKDEKLLCSLAGLGRDLKTWRPLSSDALRGFIECSDGRLYHPVIAEKAIESGSKKRKQTTRTAAANAAHWGEREEEQGDPKQRRSKRLAAARARGRHSVEQWEALVDFCEAKCTKCGTPGVVKDHIVPIYKGGSDAIENLQPMCEPCNSRKGSDTVDFRKDGWRRAVFGIKDASSHGILELENASTLKTESLQGRGQDRIGEDLTGSEIEKEREKPLSILDSRAEKDRPKPIDSSYQPSDAAIEYAYSLGMKKADLNSELSKFAADGMAKRAVSFDLDASFKKRCDQWLDYQRRNPKAKGPEAPSIEPVPLSGADWRSTVKRYKTNRSQWSRHAGPEPGMVGCRCPVQVLVDAEIDPASGYDMSASWFFIDHTTNEASAFMHDAQARKVRPPVILKFERDGVEKIGFFSQIAIPPGYDEATGEKTPPQSEEEENAA